MWILEDRQINMVIFSNKMISLSEVCKGVHDGPLQADVLSILASYATNIPNIMFMHEIFFKTLGVNLSSIMFIHMIIV